jgi:hypothetical protein
MLKILDYKRYTSPYIPQTIDVKNVLCRVEIISLGIPYYFRQMITNTIFDEFLVAITTYSSLNFIHNC